MQVYNNFLRRHQGKAQAGRSLEDGEPRGITGLAVAPPAPTPKYPRGGDSETVDSFNQESRSLEKPMMFRQVRGHATKSNWRSGSGPLVVKQDHGGKTGLKPSWEVSMKGEVRHSCSCTRERPSSRRALAGPEGQSLHRAPGPWAGP